MLLYLTDYLSEFVRAFSVFQYLTLRSMISAMTALFLSLVIGPMFIDRLSRKQIAQKVRSDGPLSHLSKEGTPTMGGSLIIVVITIVLGILFAHLCAIICVWSVMVRALPHAVFYCVLVCRRRPLENKKVGG